MTYRRLGRNSLQGFYSSLVGPPTSFPRYGSIPPWFTALVPRIRENSSATGRLLFLFLPGWLATKDCLWGRPFDGVPAAGAADKCAVFSYVLSVEYALPACLQYQVRIVCEPPAQQNYGCLH